MATKYYAFTGTAEYIHLHAPNQYGDYTIKVKLDDNEVQRYKDSGIQVEMDEENCVFFRRPETKMINKELVDLGQPKFLTEDEVTWYPQPSIGKGSKVKVHVRAYDTRKGVGHTLDEVVILDLVEYNGSPGYTD